MKTVSYQLSDELRKVLEKQLQLLSEHGSDPNGERTLVMLEVVKMLSADDKNRERNERLEAHYAAEEQCQQGENTAHSGHSQWILWVVRVAVPVLTTLVTLWLTGRL